MSRAFRRQMQPYVGKPVTVQHKSGRLYHGVLHSITDEGVILRPGNGAAMASMKIVKAGEEDSIVQAIADKKDISDAAPAWWALWFLIIFALIAAWWGLGAGWGRGYGGYGAGAGPGYGGYGAGAGPGYGGYGRNGRGAGLWW